MKLALLGIILLTAASAFSQSASVIKIKSNLRGTPSERGKVVSTLVLNQEVEVITQQGAWFLVQSTEYVGWIHGNSIRLVNADGAEDSSVVLVPVPYTPEPNKPKEPYIGMPSSEIDKSTWGRTFDIRTLETVNGKTEFWYYSYGRSLTVRNGVVVQISK